MRGNQPHIQSLETQVLEQRHLDMVRIIRVPVEALLIWN